MSALSDELCRYLELRRLQLLHPGFEPGLFGVGAFLLSQQLSLRCLQLLPQLRLRQLVLRQFSFQFAAAQADLARLLFGTFPTRGLFGERFCQPLDLLLHL